MSDLVEFLRARLAEDEEVALATIDINIRAQMQRGVAKAPRWLPEPEASGIWDETGTRRVAHTWVCEREHIVRHDPARVLAEIEAKRRIISEHSLKPASGPDLGGYYGCETCYDHPQYGIPPYGECPTLKLLALPYVDHPDYDESWRP